MTMDSKWVRTALDVILEIAAANSSIAAFRLAKLEFAPPYTDRAVFSEADSSIVTAALQLRDELKLPFWDGVMLAATSAEHVPAGVIKAATYHQQLPKEMIIVPTNELSIGYLRRLTAQVESEGRLLAMTSMVKLVDGTVMHIPMIDFHTGYSEGATRLITEVLRTLGLTGTLLKSGKSYHFYGKTLISPSELQTHLGRILLFPPIVDRAWIAHQLIEQCCALRISPRKEYGGAPVVVSAV